MSCHVMSCQQELSKTSVTLDIFLPCFWNELIHIIIHSFSKSIPEVPGNDKRRSCMWGTIISYIIYHISCIPHHIPYTVQRAPCTVHRAPCTVHRIPYTIYHTISLWIMYSQSKNKCICCMCTLFTYYIPCTYMCLSLLRIAKYTAVNTNCATPMTVPDAIISPPIINNSPK